MSLLRMFMRSPYRFPLPLRVSIRMPHLSTSLKSYIRTCTASVITTPFLRMPYKYVPSPKMVLFFDAESFGDRTVNSGQYISVSFQYGIRMTLSRLRLGACLESTLSCGHTIVVRLAHWDCLCSSSCTVEDSSAVTSSRPALDNIFGEQRLLVSQTSQGTSGS